jgi:hypothetical protein
MRLDSKLLNARIEMIFWSLFVFFLQRFVSFLIIRLKLDDEDNDVIDDAFLLLMIVDDDKGAFVKVLDDVGCLFMLMLVLLFML